jgi:hypothetical protein
MLYSSITQNEKGNKPNLKPKLKKKRKNKQQIVKISEAGRSLTLLKNSKKLKK